MVDGCCSVSCLVVDDFFFDTFVVVDGACLVQHFDSVLHLIAEEILQLRGWFVEGFDVVPFEDSGQVLSKSLWDDNFSSSFDFLFLQLGCFLPV